MLPRRRSEVALDVTESQQTSRLHLSQPAASRQLQALESETGIPLFQRVGRRLQLTAEGEDLLRHARQVLTGTDLFRDRARALKGGDTGTLKVAATRT